MARGRNTLELDFEFELDVSPTRRKGKTGGHHDLLEISKEIDERYFKRVLDTTIEWGKYNPPKNGARRFLYLGRYNPNNKLIRIHPVLNQPWVPREFVGLVTYHEKLHHVMVPNMAKHALRRGGDQDWHPELFQLAERLYENYEDLLKWEEKNLAKLLRS